MIALSAVLALVLSSSGPLSLYVKDGARLRLEVTVDLVSARHGIQAKDVAAVGVRARHQSVVNGSVLVVQLYDEEKAVPGPAGEEAAKVKAHLSKQFDVLCGTTPRESTESKPAEK